MVSHEGGVRSHALDANSQYSAGLLAVAQPEIACSQLKFIKYSIMHCKLIQDVVSLPYFLG